jgi:hypothetical protein
MRNTEPEPLKTLEDAGRDWLGGICRKSVENLIRDGVLPVIKIGGRSFIGRDDAKRLIARGRRRHRRPASTG